MTLAGGNTGIGKATVKALLSKNAKVYMACRSEQKATEAIQLVGIVAGMLLPHGAHFQIVACLVAI